MDIRLTLRLTETLNKKIELEKQRIGLSKNQIIVQACKKIVESTSKKNNVKGE